MYSGDKKIGKGKGQEGGMATKPSREEGLAETKSLTMKADKNHPENTILSNCQAKQGREEIKRSAPSLQTLYKRMLPVQNKSMDSAKTFTINRVIIRCLKPSKGRCFQSTLRKDLAIYFHVRVIHLLPTSYSGKEFQQKLKLET